MKIYLRNWEIWIINLKLKKKKLVVLRRKKWKYNTQEQNFEKYRSLQKRIISVKHTQVLKKNTQNNRMIYFVEIDR